MNQPFSPAAARARTAFRRRFEQEPSLVARAPGRVNLIGDHTDYNDGFVLPMALPFDTVIAAVPISGHRVEVASEGYRSASFVVTDPPSDTVAWARYIHGMAAVMHDEGLDVGGWQGCIDTDIPGGAGLSSSAALEIAAGLIFAAAAGKPLTDADAARLGRRVENEVFGLPSGVMDQLACAASVAGCASLIDCRSLSVTPTAIPARATVIVMDTGTRRTLVDSAYADRQATCARVAASLGVPALRDATLADIARLDPADAIGRQRARHVVTENQRVLDTVTAFASDDLMTAGRLMNESHASLSADYEVSGPALDAIVALAAATPGCFGARMTGGGFAGGAVALVDKAHANAFCGHLAATYTAPSTQPATAPPAFYAVTPSPGASLAVP